MAVNIKSERVERLLDEVAALTGETKTEAVRRALEERREQLIHASAGSKAADRLRRVLELEIWPNVAPDQLGKRLTKVQEDALLGFGPDGV